MIEARTNALSNILVKFKDERCPVCPSEFSEFCGISVARLPTIMMGCPHSYDFMVDRLCAKLSVAGLSNHDDGVRFIEPSVYSSNTAS